MSKFSELEDIAERVWLLHTIDQIDAPWLNFLMDTKQLSKSSTLLLALVIFDGYELFPAHDAARKKSARAGAGEQPPQTS